VDTLLAINKSIAESELLYLTCCQIGIISDYMKAEIGTNLGETQ
jgi:hypothetical protein